MGVDSVPLMWLGSCWRKSGCFSGEILEANCPVDTQNQQDVIHIEQDILIEVGMKRI